MMHVGAQRAWAVQQQMERPLQKHSQATIQVRHRQQTAQLQQEIRPQLPAQQRQQSSRRGMLSARYTQAAECTGVSLAQHIRQPTNRSRLSRCQKNECVSVRPPFPVAVASP